MKAISLLEKQKVREQMLEKRSAMSKEEVAEKSAEIVRKLVALPEFEKARSVMLYSSVRNEVITDKAIEEARRLGKKVMLPVTNTAEKKIYACEFREGEKLTKGPYGISEPERKIAVENIDLVLVPGIAFDREGGRIGCGFGYYDVFLKTTSAKKVGLSFDSHIVEKLPQKEYDVVMDAVISEKQVIRNGC
jgi:5-formyltetrahydrofolate cyclo-ligase